MTGLPQLIVVVRVTTDCPLRCKFCGFSRDLEFPRVGIDAARLLRFGEVLNSFQSIDGRPVLVSWLGGEPYQWPDWYRVSLAFKQLDLQLGITTNGIALSSPRVRQQTIELFRQVTISVDGLRSEHDRVRQSPGLFDRLRENTRRLRAEDVTRGLLLRCNTVLMRSNIEQFGDFCEEMADWGFDELTFNQLGGNDRPEFFGEHRLLPSQVEWFAKQLPRLQQRMQTRGLVIQGTDQYLRRLISSSRDRPIEIQDCRPAETFLFVSETGLISPCSFTIDDYGIPLEAVNTAHKISRLHWDFHLQRMNHRSTACADCHATHVFDKFGSDEPAYDSFQPQEKNGIQ